MLRSYENDTIAAISTPIGEGGLSVIRVSGGASIRIADQLFHGKKKISECASHTVHFGKLQSRDGKTLDEVVTTLFKSPNTYTGEDVIEFSCHGGVFVAKQVLEEIIASGARLAEPGEFTKRAFLNGKMDLSQAEAVADLIHSRSGSAHKASLAQLEGWLSREIGIVRDQLINALGLLELELDFVEEGLEFVDKSKVAGLLKTALEKTNALIESFNTGKVYREGVSVVLAGASNVGKSSLLNVLLNENRAIVTSVPGTTRDVIEESITLEGILFRITDTAGLRETEDIVEKEGVRRTEKKIQESDVVVAMFDASRPIQEEERGFIRQLQDQKRVIIPVVNKIDLEIKKNGSSDLYSSDLLAMQPLRVSALTREGVDKLKEELVRRAFGKGENTIPDSSFVVTNTRHVKALERAKQGLRSALEALLAGTSSEFVAIDLRSGLDSLGEITGAVTNDEILNNIFSKFCIGK